MRLILDFWNRSWQSVRFDTDTGRGRVRWLRSPPKTTDGWAYRHRGRWFALWKDGDQFVFQAGQRTWRMGDEVTCRLEDVGRRRRFTLTRSGTVELELDYRPASALSAAVEPTFDELDDELQDFFLWLQNVWSNPRWQARLLHPRSSSGA